MKTSDHAGVSAPAVLCHPLVLKGAWMRIDAWYRSGNLAPEPELSRWRLHPEAELRALASALRAGEWQPSPWPEVPYPKKGACLRVPNFVFGNRWNRSIAWDRRRSNPQWVLRPYQLLTSAAYRPYARSHGLFRRVAHWTVARMTGARIEDEDYGGYVQHPDDYRPDSLPCWTRQEWWSPRGSNDARAYWATLDIELAYPSIRLCRLRNALSNMLNSPTSASLAELCGGFPQAILDDLADPDEITRIGCSLMSALDRVEFDPKLPIDAWRPFHSHGDLPPEKDPGLPTGLAVSGILLNVALYPADQSVLKYLDEHGDGAIVRFADEFIVLARTGRGLFDLMEAVWRALAEDADARLVRAETKSNLHLNWNKIEPCAVREIVASFLQEHKWKECQECHDLYRCSTSEEAPGFGEWWGTGEDRKAQSALIRSTIGPREVGPFVTTLVERMSEIGRDTLAERFGEGARQRLIRLHDLARFDIDDLQVRSDTRRTFAVNRLVRAWLPADSAVHDLVDIRESVAHVLRITPWKFSLWHAVVRAAVRRPPKPTPVDDHTANDWLSSRLGLVADPPDKRRVDAWMSTWPEEDVAAEKHERNPAWRRLYLSFHRAAFWHALAVALRSLWRHEDDATHPSAGYSGPSPDLWTVRAVPEGVHDRVRRQLGTLDQWVDVLYPRDSTSDLRTWRWELDQLTAAALASASRHDLAVAWRHAEPPDDGLTVPAGSLWDRIPRTYGLLERHGRVSPHSDPHHLALPTLAHLWLGGQDHRLGALLFPRDGSSPIAEVQDDQKRAVAAGISLGCSENINADLASVLVSDTERSGEVFRADGLTLWEYHRARRILLGQPARLQ